jgi:hypothetical protein
MGCDGQANLGKLATERGDVGFGLVVVRVPRFGRKHFGLCRGQLGFESDALLAEHAKRRIVTRRGCSCWSHATFRAHRGRQRREIRVQRDEIS